MLTVVAGTLSHETGHFMAAKSVGYEARINYAYTYTHVPSASTDDSAARTLKALWITSAGPLLTIITGTIGLMILFIKKRKQKLHLHAFGWDWLLVFITLCWLRQPVNLATRLMKKLLVVADVLARDSQQLQESGGDEIVIAKALGLPSLSIEIATAAAGLGVLCLVLFKILDKNIRYVFLSGLAAGGVLGYYLWLIWLGPILLP